MTDVRSLAVQRALSQVRGETAYQLHYRIDDAEGEQRELVLALKLHGENLKSGERTDIKLFIGKKVCPMEIFEIFQILCLKVGSPNEELTFTRTENDSDLIELLMSTEIMIKISEKCKDVYIESVLMIQANPLGIAGAPNQTKTTTMVIGLVMD